MIVNSFNHQFSSSKLGKHSSLRKTCQVSKDVKRMSLEESRAVGVAALYNDSFKSCCLSLIWKTSLVITIPKHGKDSSHGTSCRPISLLCPVAKVLEMLILSSINKFISPAKDQHDFRPRHLTTSALLQLTTDIETGFN